MHKGSTSEHMFIYTVKITVLMFVLHISTADYWSPDCFYSYLHLVLIFGIFYLSFDNTPQNFYQ